ncbi:MAG: hypothetical protein RMJ37_00390 [Spirochaetia bacterium]|nr:hypothetical protein [Spirochaetota bacterium]MCX8096853.1 hypothetical protein [Spirochaetota bacterium]MDW8111787.1 hypothetical protein [Spirochaetia bacterium]
MLFVRILISLVFLCCLYFNTNALSYKKYELLLSESNYIFVQASYKSESLSSQVFYKYNEFLSFGFDFWGIFSVPIYTYSGYIEENLTFYKIGIYANIFKFRLFNKKFGFITRFSTGSIIDYRDFLISFEIYSYDSLLENLYYLISLKDVGFGIYYTTFIPLNIVVSPILISTGIRYKIYNLNIDTTLFGIAELDTGRYSTYASLYLAYKLFEGMSIGLGNTFRIGNYLNIELFSSLSNEIFTIRAGLGFGYINGIIANFEFSTKI